MCEWLELLEAPSILPWARCEEEDVAFIVKDTLGRPMWKDNPRTATEEDVRELVQHCLTDWRTENVGGSR